jgi:hypothetical protein
VYTGNVDFQGECHAKKTRVLGVYIHILGHTYVFCIVSDGGNFGNTWEESKGRFEFFTMENHGRSVDLTGKHGPHRELHLHQTRG